MNRQLFVGTESSDAKWSMEVSEVTNLSVKKPTVLAFVQELSGEF